MLYFDNRVVVIFAFYGAMWIFFQKSIDKEFKELLEESEKTSSLYRSSYKNPKMMFRIK